MPTGQEPSGPQTPSAVPDAARRELRLLNATEAILAANDPGRARSVRSRILTQIRRGHVDHRTALTATAPTTRPTGATPPIGGESATAPTPSASAPARRMEISKAVSGLRSAEEAASADYLEAADASDGVLCLFWSSLAAASAAYAVALQTNVLPAPEQRPRQRMQLVPPPEVEAMQSMVAQLHAVNYGYQLAIGRLNQAARRQAIEVLQRRRGLRNRLTETLVDQQQSVPAAAPAYVPPVRPTNAATATELIRRIEVALQPWTGRWVAAATRPEVRRLAVRTLLDGSRTSVRWGAALPTWPGWQE